MEDCYIKQEQNDICYLRRAGRLSVIRAEDQVNQNNVKGMKEESRGKKIEQF